MKLNDWNALGTYLVETLIVTAVDCTSLVQVQTVLMAVKQVLGIYAYAI